MEEYSNNQNLNGRKSNLIKVSAKNLPSRIPVAFIGVCILILDRYQAPGWLWGAVLGILGVYTLANIYARCTEPTIELTLDNLDELGGEIHGGDEKPGFHC